MTPTFPKKPSKPTKATAFKSSPQDVSNCPFTSLTDIGISTTQYGHRFREAYAKQRQRSHLAYPEHFAMINVILERCPNTLIHRVHLKRDNNATVDHAHALTDISEKTCHVVLNTLHHAWELPKETVQALHFRGGPKVGAASIFNQYMPSFEHDWMDAVFGAADYSDRSSELY